VVVLPGKRPFVTHRTGGLLGPRASLEALQGSDCDFSYRESNHVQFVSCLLYQVMAKGECRPSDGNLTLKNPN